MHGHLCHNKFVFLSLAVCIFLIPGCRQFDQEIASVTLSFYHWKTTWQSDQTEQDYLNTLHVKTIYLRFFDIDWNQESQTAIPVGVLQIIDTFPAKVAVVPTVFLTNRTFLNLAEKDIGKLAEQVYDKIKQLQKKYKIENIPEIQMDCDWSGKTKVAYFTFLNILKNRLKTNNLRLSTTIRLHQIKYFKSTGIPPIDRGVLMFYNMGNLSRWATENSILDLSIAKEYLTNFKAYPLPLDIALPLFSWAVLFRDGKMIKLINQLEAETLQDTSRFLKIGKNKYKVIKSTYLNGHYLYQEDLLRMESVSIKQLKDASFLLRDYTQKTSNINLIFYHLDSSIIKNIPHESLDAIRKIWSAKEK